MEKKLKLIKIISGAVAVLLLIGSVGAFIYSRNLKSRAIPDYSKNIVLKRLLNEVTIFRDNHGVPHIYAINDHDLYMATGYCMAQDRMWQMDLLRRVTTGRLSEIFGDDLVETDLLFRALRIQEKSETILKELDPEILRSLNAFSDGINQFLAHNKENLPWEFSVLGYEPEDWEPIHTINLIGYMAWDLTKAWEMEVKFDRIRKKVGDDLLNDLLPDIKGTEQFIYSSNYDRKILNDLKSTLIAKTRIVEDLGISVFNASNNWAVAGNKTFSESPLLSNDMHLDLSIPGIWYQMHMCVEGSVQDENDADNEIRRLDVTGVAVPGAPVIVSGHNKRIAWGMTNVMIDDMDFFLEKIDPQNPDKYFYKGEWKDMEVRTEKIIVKGGDVIEKKLRFTVHGPIISEFKKVKDRAISMHWVGNYPSDEVSSMYKLNRARNFGDFKDALRTFKSLSQNIVYADIFDNIGILCAAGIPVRRKGNGTDIVPGWTDEYEWRGFVPFEQQPLLYNPPSGVLASANNKTSSNSFPHYVSRWFYPPYRYNRIKQVLNEKEKLKAEDYVAMHTDVKSLLAIQVKGRMIKAVSGMKDINDSEKEILELFKKWDGSMDKQSAMGAFFDVFYNTLIKNTFKDEMGEDLFAKFIDDRIGPIYAMDNMWNNEKSAWFDNIDTKNRKETMDDIIAASFREAAAWCDDELGGNPEKWEWGDIHKLNLRHPLGKSGLLNFLFDLNREGYPSGGSFHTVLASLYTFHEPYEFTFGASQRHAYDLGNWDNSYSIIPTGVSGIPGSKYYCDQTEMYVEGKCHKDYFSKEQIIRTAKYTMKFVHK